MELSNALYESGIEPDTATPDELFAVREAVMSLVRMLAPFAPHTAEELYSVIVGNENGMLANGARFPVFDEEAARAEEIEIAVQVNGKLRSRIFAPPDADRETLEQMALFAEKISDYTEGKEVARVIVVPNRLVNIVVKG